MAQGGQLKGPTAQEFQLAQQQQVGAALQDTMKNIMSMWDQEQTLKESARATNLQYQWNMMKGIMESGTATQSMRELAIKFGPILENTFRGMGFSPKSSKAYVDMLAESEVSAEQWDRAFAAWTGKGWEDPQAAEQGINSTLAKAVAESRDTGAAGGAVGGQVSATVPGAAPARPAQAVIRSVNMGVPGQGEPLPTLRIPETEAAEIEREFEGIAPRVKDLPRVDVEGVTHVDNFFNWKRVDQGGVPGMEGLQFFSGSANMSPMDLGYGWLEAMAKPDSVHGGKVITGSDIPQDLQTGAAQLVSELKQPELASQKEAFLKALALVGAQDAGVGPDGLKEIMSGGYQTMFRKGLSTMSLPDPARGMAGLSEQVQRGLAIMDELDQDQGPQARAVASIPTALGKGDGSPMAVQAQNTMDMATQLLDEGVKLFQGGQGLQGLVAVRKSMLQYDKFQKLLGLTKTEVDRAFDSHEAGPMRDYLAAMDPGHLAVLQAKLDAEAAASPSGQLKNLAELMSKYAEVRTAEARIAEAGATVEGLPVQAEAARLAREGKDVELETKRVALEIARQDMATMLKRAELAAREEDGSMTDQEKERALLQRQTITDLQNQLQSLTTNKDGTTKDVSAWKPTDVAAYNTVRDQIQKAYETTGLYSKEEIDAIMAGIPKAEPGKPAPNQFLFFKWGGTSPSMTTGSTTTPTVTNPGAGAKVLTGTTGYTTPTQQGGSEDYEEFRRSTWGG